MNVYLWELRRNARSFLVWVASISAYCILMVFVFPTLREQAASYTTLMESMKGVLEAFNMGSLDFGDFLSYLAGYCVTYCVLAGAIFAAMQGANALAREEADRTAEFLFSKPITRTRAAAAKLGAAGTLIALMALLFAAASGVGVGLFAPQAGLREVLIILADFALALGAYMAVGFLTAAALKKPKSAGAIGSGIVLGTFTLGALSRVAAGFNWLAWLSPMDWFPAAETLESGLDPAKLLLWVAIVAGSIAGGIVLCNKRDFRA